MTLSQTAVRRAEEHAPSSLVCQIPAFVRLMPNIGTADSENKALQYRDSPVAAGSAGKRAAVPTMPPASLWTAARPSGFERAVASSGEVLGAPRKTGKGHLKSYGEGRLCAARDCSTMLSRYNSTWLCSVHEKAEALLRR